MRIFLHKGQLYREVIFENLADILTIIWREKEGFNMFPIIKSFQTNKCKAFDFKVLDCMYFM